MGFLDSKSSTVQNTTNEVLNQHATAGADGFAVGAGSNVNIEEVSDDIAIAALEANEDVSQNAFNLADDTVGRLANFGNDALDTVANFSEDALNEVANLTENQTSDFLGFATNFVNTQNAAIDKQLETNNRFAQSTNELIAAQAGVVAPTDNKRNQLLVGGALLLVALIVGGPQIAKAIKGS